MQKEFQELNKAILAANDILLVTHPNPDGDAIGSITAMIGFLKSLNKNYFAFCQDPVPDNFSYLPWAENVINEPNQLINFNPDLVMFLDFTDWHRSGLVNLKEKLIDNGYNLAVLDHHYIESPNFDYGIINIKSSSTSEIIFDFFQCINWQFENIVANSLLTGMLTDTEHFSNPATKVKVVSIASQLVKRGASFNKLTNKTWRTRSFEDLKLIGLAFERLSYHKELGLAVTVIKQEDMTEYGLSNETFGGVSDIIKGLSTGQAILVLKETSIVVKGSLRSISYDVDVAKFARIFGGGGHKLASGFAIPGQLVYKENGWQVI
jgi:bifunctional oligoribonuclease and PAP phosphatase NrnA